MDPISSKATRRLILTILYEQYLADPLRMLTPEEMLVHDGLSRENLAANSHYLHDRGFIELLLGYKPPLFAAARIAPQGIDLMEDRERLRQLLGQDAPVIDAVSVEGPRMVLEIADEVHESGLSAIRKKWLLEDLHRLRDEFRKEPHDRREEVIRNSLSSIGEYFEGDPAAALPSLERLTMYLSTGK